MIHRASPPLLQVGGWGVPAGGGVRADGSSHHRRPAWRLASAWKQGPARALLLGAPLPPRLQFPCSGLFSWSASAKAASRGETDAALPASSLPSYLPRCLEAVRWARWAFLGLCLVAGLAEEPWPLEAGRFLGPGAHFPNPSPSNVMTVANQKVIWSQLITWVNTIQGGTCF